MFQYNSHQFYSSFSPSFCYHDNSEKYPNSYPENFSNYNSSTGYNSLYLNPSSHQYLNSSPAYQFDSANSSLGYYSNGNNTYSPTSISNFVSIEAPCLYNQSTPVAQNVAVVTPTNNCMNNNQIKGGRNLCNDLGNLALLKL